MLTAVGDHQSQDLFDCTRLDESILNGCRQSTPPRLIMEDSAPLLLVPSPRVATVPHRELPGLSPMQE
jgi:hypothetical protein